MNLNHMFVYRFLKDREVEYEGRRLFLPRDKLPMDYCPSCEHFDDDHIPSCFIYRTPEEVKLNGKTITLMCPKQIDYLRSLYAQTITTEQHEIKILNSPQK